jgi:hypothetical protein
MPQAKPNADIHMNFSYENIGNTPGCLTHVCPQRAYGIIDEHSKGVSSDICPRPHVLMSELTLDVLFKIT